MLGVRIVRKLCVWSARSEQYTDFGQFGLAKLLPRLYTSEPVLQAEADTMPIDDKGAFKRGESNFRKTVTGEKYTHNVNKGQWEARSLEKHGLVVKVWGYIICHLVAVVYKILMTL